MEHDTSAWLDLGPCGVDGCRSRKYFYDSGYYQCQRGHRHDSQPITGQDEDSYGTQGQTTKKQREAAVVAKQHLAGREAFEHYLLCYQLILQKQIWALTKEKGFPADLEAVVIELWALRLTKLQDRVPDTADTDGESSQYYSSQSDDEKTSEAESETDARLRRRGKRPNAAPSLLDSVALCYLSLLCLRIPITLGDMLRWVQDEEIIYYRAIKSIPLAMKARLPGAYHGMLEPTDILKPSSLQRVVLDLAILYKRDHQVIFPPLNTPPLLYGLLQKLALPVEIYPMVFKLAELVNYSFDFAKATTTRRYRGTDVPERQLVSLMVVAVKILYPFDSLERHTTKTSHPASAVINWDTWAAVNRPERESDQRQQPSSAGMQRLGEADVFSMNSTSLDLYLDWYQKTWAEENIPTTRRHAHFQEEMFKMFPLQALSTSDQLQQGAEGRLGGLPPSLSRIAAVQQDLKGVKAVNLDMKNEPSEKGMLRPGSLFKHYRKAEDLQGHARKFYEETAQIAGISLESLVWTVFMTERKLSRWREERSRARKNENLEFSNIALSVES